MNTILERTALFASLLVVCVMTPFSTVLAIGDQFTVTQTVISADTEPPSTPQNLVATPISMFEIDIDWDNSTDNVGVLGYQVFRDGVQIATTTISQYSDSGLTPATSYAYRVVAFDAADNFSTSSATSTATTDAEPSVDPSPGGGPPHYVVPVLYDLRINVTETTARIRWETSIPVRSTVSWGETIEYELGSLQEDEYVSRHATEIRNLTPGTLYKFRIVARDHAGNETLLHEGSFETVSLPDYEPPPNVSSLTGVVDGNDAVLTWRNPSADDFDYVRIIRKEGGYPKDAYDGVIVYEGDGTAFRDKDVFSGDGVRYYAVFAYDASENGSSGAVLRLEKRDGGFTTEPVIGPVIDLGTSSPYAPLSLRDVIVEQGGKVVEFVGERIPLRGDQPFTLKIPYELLPEHLKTILVTLSLPNDPSRTFTFILRVDTKKSFYSATIDALGTGGSYGLSLSILDYEDQTISTMGGSLEVRRVESNAEEAVTFIGSMMRSLGEMNFFWLIIFGFLILIVIIAIVSERDRRYRTRSGINYIPMR